MESKKADLRDQAKPKVSIPNTESRMAGSEDNPNNKPHSDMHLLTPEVGKNVPAGQVTKSS